MGTYVVTIDLCCPSRDGEVLKRFGEVNADPARKALAMAIFTGLQAPDAQGNPDPAFTQQVHALMQQHLEAAILQDLNQPNSTVRQVVVFKRWSPPTGGTQPHEGLLAPVLADVRDANGNVTLGMPWEITRNGVKQAVHAHAMWVHFA